jgi:hypothetical protein
MVAAALKHASSTDYTTTVLAFATIVLILSTLAICARLWARYLINGTGVDDVLALLGWVSGGQWATIASCSLFRIVVHSLTMRLVCVACQCNRELSE